MIRVIDGKRYNTDTAEYICEVSCDTPYTNDFRWHDTRLYRTRSGQYFLAGQGGAMSMWARRVADGTVGGQGILLVDTCEAMELAESEQRAHAF